MIDIDELKKEDKLLLFEQLWVDLSKNYQEDVIPSWHKEELKKREELGKNPENFIDLKDVKKNLQKFI